MKTFAKLLLAALLAAAAPVQRAAAQALDFTIYITGPLGGTNIYTQSQVQGLLTQNLVLPIPDQTFMCNNSGVTAVPGYCTLGSGLGMSGGVLSNTAPTYSFSVGSPNSRSVSLSTAYQASNSAKPAHVTLNLTSSAALSLTSGVTNTASVYIGSTSGVSSGSGTLICQYANSLTGSLVVGLNVATTSTMPCSIDLPAGWYFAVIQLTGTVTIASAFDQSLG